MKKITTVLISLVLSTVLNAQEPKQEVKNLNPDAFKVCIDRKDKNAILLDLRTDDEVKRGIIPGATQIDFLGKDFDSKLEKLDKNKTYYIYCESGGRSGEAVEVLEKKGFKSVYNLEKGFSLWKHNGLPVEIPK